MNRYRVFRPVLCIALLLVQPLAQRAAEPEQKVQVAELSSRAEQAIRNGLTYLSNNQKKDGSWGEKHPVAVTALSLMAFMVKGYQPDRGDYGDQLSRGVDFLLKESRTGGGYMGKSMYEHGLATLALSEAWGMSLRGDDIRDALKRAVKVILESQSKAGGWRYQPDQSDADISITVMQIMALASAKEAGILVPDETIAKAVGYVKSCFNKSAGGFGYQGPRDPGFARTAAGVTSLLMAGEKNAPEVLSGLQYLQKNSKEDRWYYYGHYYAVQAMYQAGESYYQEWYPKIRDALLAKQDKDGNWKGEGYETPMAILILGVPYRFLPIYQR